MTFAYLAHPIDLAGENSWFRSMLVDLKLLLAEAEIGAYQPGEAYLANIQTHSHTRFINDMNNIAIHQADALIAVLPADLPTLGTPVEIGFALSCHKPVVIFTDIEASVQVAAWIRAGAVVFNMGAPDFEWPGPADLRDAIEDSRLYQEERCKGATESTPGTLLEVSSPPLLVSGQAANLQPGKYAGDAGIDLAIMEDSIVPADQFRYLDTGVHVAIPQGYFGWITGRSSTWRDFRCSVVTAIIDSGYRGELKIGIRNESGQAQRFESGTRLGQLILLPVFAGGTEHVNELPESERGLNGYGSSGR